VSDDCVPGADVTVVAWTHVGMVRRRNEDAIALPGVVLTGSPLGPITTSLPVPRPVERKQPDPAEGGVGPLVAVVDGMGGHVGGAEASTLAASRLAHARSDAEAALEAVNSELYDEMDRRPELRSMGATVAGVQVTPGAVGVFNVGDARVYTHIGGYSTLVSVDDRSATGSGELTQSLGGAAQRTRISVHRRSIPLDRPMRLLLCSDGLSEYVEFRDVEEALDGLEPVRVAEHLVELTLRAGAPDNVSVAIIDWPGADGAR
jgi:PPM family protein phosphatase